MKISYSKHRRQKDLYDKFADILFMLCFRYVKNEMDASSILNGGFLKIFNSVESNSFSNDKHLENWMKKIMVNECLMFLRKKKNIFSEAHFETDVESTITTDNNLIAEDYYKMINALPDGYRTIFNLYAIEGFSHTEISQNLNISESTSRSQLTRARALLQKWINSNNIDNEG